MSLVLQIVPFNDGIDMFGEPDSSSAYSLSGHVSISVAASYSFFESRRPIHLLLQSLVLTFEGQSEIFTHSTGYSSLRLCSITRELVPGEPLKLSKEGNDEDGVWNIVFNLTIPGWLPSSSVQGVGDFGVKYSLSATARFMSSDGDHAVSAWSPFAALCAPFRPRFRSAETCKAITLRRYINPPSEVLEIPMINYLVHSTPSRTKEPCDKIPPMVLSSIQVLVSLPEYIDVEATEVPLALRLRTKDLREEDCGKLQLTDISLDILQTEQFRSRPNSVYLAQYPIPPREMQPPNLPLRDSHTMNFIYGDFFTAGSSESSSRTLSILPSNESGNFKLEENNYIFKDDRKEEAPTWYTINTFLPFDKFSNASFETDGVISWSDCLGLRPSSCGPLFSVHHQVAVSLTISYDLECGGVAKEKLNFKLPVTFANIAPVIPFPSCYPFLGLVANNSEASSAPSSPTPLPAYSQLYDQNGERKIDYSVPLPLYTPKTLRRRDDEDTKDERMSLLVDLGKQKEKHPLASAPLVADSIESESASCLI